MSQHILNNPCYPKFNIDDFYNSYEFEIELIGHILNGKLEEAIGCYEDFFSKEYIYNIADRNQLAYMKNYVISLSFLICHHVIVKGVSPYSAKAKQHAFSKLVHKSINIDEILDIGKIVVEAYIKQLSGNISNIDNVYIKNAINYIHDNLGEDISLDMVADNIGLSKCYFCSQFKKELNMSFTDYLSYIRVDKSKHLLLHTNRTILDIAISVGFNSQSYFTTQFKKFTGNSPKEFRSGKNLYKK